MAPKHKLIPPLRPNSDGSGFVRIDRAKVDMRGVPAPTCSTRQGPRSSRGTAASRVSSSSSSSYSSLSTSSYASAARASKSTVEAAALPRQPESAQNRGAAERKGGERTCAATQEGSSGLIGAANLSDSRGATSRASNVGNAEATSTRGVGTIFSVRSDASLLSSECRLSPGACKKLGLSTGCVVRAVAAVAESGTKTSVCAYLEVVLSPSSSASNDVVILGEETAALFPTPQVCLAAVSSGSSNVSLAEVCEMTIEVFVEKASGGGGTGTEEEEGGGFAPVASSALQWRALFRRAYANRVVYAGLRASLQHSTFRVAVEVIRVSINGASESSATALVGAAYGLLSLASVIYVGTGEVSGGVTKEGILEKRLVDHNEDAVTSVEGDLVPCTSAVEHLLVVGGSGTGKTRYLENVAQKDRASGRRVFHVRVEELPQGEGSDVATATVIRELFAEAVQSSPATVLLDDLHLLCGSGSSASSSSASSLSIGSHWSMALFTHAICDALREAAEMRVSVRLVASAPSSESLPAELRTASRLGAAARVVSLHPPGNSEERIECLRSCIAEVAGSESELLKASDLEVSNALSQVAVGLHGFTQRDVRRLVEAAAMGSFKTRGTTRFALADIQGATKHVHPSCLKQFEVAVPDVIWADIGGSAEAKQTLQDVVEWCLGKQKWIFTQFRLTPPKGVLLYGPPGCSKTMLAKALANESGMNFISVKGPEVFSKWVGDSEKAVRDIFARARAAAPCVVFIDELDGMCSHRGRGGVSDRVISQFLTELDGLPAAFEEKANALVFVAATNRPDNIDGAVLRPGRIDRRVYVGLPALEEREAIVSIQFRRLPTAPDLSATYVAERTEGYTGAEVVAVIKEAAFVAISINAQAAYIQCENVEAALRKVRPRVNAKDVEWYKSWPHKSEKMTAS